MGRLRPVITRAIYMTSSVQHRESSSFHASTRRDGGFRQLADLFNISFRHEASTGNKTKTSNNLGTWFPPAARFLCARFLFWIAVFKRLAPSSKIYSREKNNVSEHR